MLQDPDLPITGPNAIFHALSRINMDKVEAEAREDIKSGKKTRRGPAIRRLNVLAGLRKNELQPKDLTISKVPVIPPMYRPFSIAGDTFLPGDANELYKDLITYRNLHGELTKEVGESNSHDSAYNLYKAVKAVYGFDEAVNPKTRQRGVAGFLQHLIGKSGGPKFSTFHRRLFSKTMDSVSRGVITAGPELNMDEIGVPEEMAWKMYGPYVQRRLVQSGMGSLSALDNVTKRSDHAQKALEREMGERPVIYARAPAWHKYNVVAGWGRLNKGDNISLNPYVSTGLNADHDGDTINLHLPSMQESVDEAKDILMPSKMVYSIKEPDKIVPALKHEQILGLYTAKHRPSKKTHLFKDEAEALAAIKKGDVSLSDDIEFSPGETISNMNPSDTTL